MSQSNRALQRKLQEALSLTLALVLKSGKYTLGFNQALENVRNGTAKLVLVSNTCPELMKSQLDYLCMMNKTPLQEYAHDARELGLACGKSFNVSVFTVTEAGDADLSSFK